MKGISNIVVESNVDKVYSNKLETMKISSKAEKFTYNAEMTVNKTVNSVKDILPDIISDIHENIKIRKPFLIGIDSPMGTNKTLAMRSVYRYLKEGNIAKVIYISGATIINYQQLYDVEEWIKEDKSYMLETQKYFVGENKEDMDLENLKGDVLISNINFFRRAINLMKKNNEKFMVVLDECHIPILDYLFRNSIISNEEKIRLINEFESLMCECLEINSANSCIGSIWLSATMESLSYNKDILFTKMYNLNVPNSKKITIKKVRPIVIDKINSENSFHTVIKTLEESKKGEIHVFYWNTSLKNMNRLIEKVKKYQTNNSNLEDINLENSFVAIHRDNVEVSETYKEIKNKSRIPANVNYIITSSILSTGVNIIEEDRKVNVTLFCDRETFSFANEMQIPGRMRKGVEILQVVAERTGNTNIPHFKSYYKKELPDIMKEINSGIKFLSNLRNTDTAEGKRAKILSCANPKDLGNVYNYIVVENNEFAISKFGVMCYCYLSYARKHILGSMKGLISNFYHHKAINVESVEEIQELDYKDKEKLYKNISEMVKDKKDKNLIKDDRLSIIKKNASSELRNLISGKINFNDVSKITQDNYRILQAKDYKFKVVESAVLTEDEVFISRIVDMYISDEYSESKLKKELSAFKAIIDNEALEKSKDNKERERQVKTLRKSNMDSVTLYNLKKILKEMYGEDINFEDKKIWRDKSFNKGERKKIYDRLIEEKALGRYEYDTKDKNEAKKLVYYQEMKTQKEELRRCLSLLFTLKKGTFRISKIK